MRACSSAPMRATTSARSATSATSSRSCGCASSTRRRRPRRRAGPATSCAGAATSRLPSCIWSRRWRSMSWARRGSPGPGPRRRSRSHRGPGEPVAMRAWFLKGRIAADDADAAGVRRALAALGRSPNPELQADRLELTGRLELLEGRPERALAAFRDSADLRRDAEDYLGMARVLALAGAAAERAGPERRCRRSLLPRRAQRRGRTRPRERPPLARRRRPPGRDHRPGRDPRRGERASGQPRGG